MSWSAYQRRLIDALGYELLLPGQPGALPAVRDFPAAATTPVQASATATAWGGEALDRLVEALRRAAGGADPLPLAGDLARLRRDPAAKRALWPRLRALRRGGP